MKPMLRIDHIGIGSRDPQSAAASLATILGAPPPTVDGADDDMFRVDLDDGAFLLFAAADPVHAEHVAFRVPEARFAAVVERLRARGIPFGNDPEAPTNGATSDPLGGGGRVYFATEEGHLFEVTC